MSTSSNLSTARAYMGVPEALGAWLPGLPTKPSGALWRIVAVAFAP